MPKQAVDPDRSAVLQAGITAADAELVASAAVAARAARVANFLIIASLRERCLKLPRNKASSMSVG
jgi:hypothetical protein